MGLDHASDSWSYVSTLLTTQDAQAIDPSLVGFNAADIYAAGDTHRLIVSPTAGLYLGCIEYQLDLGTGQLQDRQGDGPDALWTHPKNTDPGVIQTGACTYDQHSSLGVVVGDTHLSGVQFRLYATGHMR